MLGGLAWWPNPELGCRFPDVAGALPTRYFVMAGTPEKILEHLLEFMRLDATLYDPMGRWGISSLLWGPCPRATVRWAGGCGQGASGEASTEWSCLIPSVQPQKASPLILKSPIGTGRGSQLQGRERLLSHIPPSPSAFEEEQNRVRWEPGDVPSG